ncbi:hypothetical protein SUNI508_04358 [Seiridium unicorne]|uniref:Tat pathway signal sequence n=1 Tax=Seiridium unicorne TaxID=138068 RepID=A0ABR2V820_9PEZI
MAKAYRHIPLEEEEPLTAGSDVDEKLVWRSERKSILDRLQSLSPHWVWFAHALLLSLSMTFFALSFCLKSAKHSGAERLPDTYSPALDAIKYEIQHFDLPPVAEGPFIGKGPEVDAMWEYITDGIPDTMITREEMIKMGQDPKGALEITDPRTGKRGYRVAVEVFHQLHCLNLLRQNNYKSHYKPMGGDTADDPHDLSGHMDHCIDALRQFVMCQGDVNVFTFRYPFGDDDPWPDYTVPHVCRNFENIRNWAIEHGVPKTPGEPDH